MSSEYTSYYLQSLNSKLGLQTERRNRNKAHTFDNGRRVCSDFSILKNVNERNFKSATTGPLYAMLPDLMTAIREPKALPNPKRLSSNRRGISQRRSSVAVKEKIAHCNSGNSKARNVCYNGSGDQHLSKVTSSITEDRGQTTNAVYRDLLKRMAEVPEISHTKIDESSLHKNKVEKLYSHSTSTIQPSPLTSPRLTIVPSKKDDPARNAIMLRTIKRGKMYGPEAIAAVSGFGITQSVIMDSSGSYTYLQIPSSKKSTNNKEKSSSQLSHDAYDISATTPSPIDKNMWTIEKENKKLGKDKRRSTKKGYNSEDDNESKMPMPTARKMLFQAVNMHELSRSRNNLTKLTINSHNPVLHSVTNKSNSESQMPRPNDSAYEKIATSLSVPSMPVAVTSLLSGDTQQSFTSIRPTKPLIQNIMLCCKSNIGDGDMNVENFVNSKRGKMKTSRKVTRKVHNSKKKRSTKRAKRTRTRSTKPPDLRLKGPKIKGINYNLTPFQELDRDETQLSKIRTVILPFPMQKYKHTI